MSNLSRGSIAKIWNGETPTPLTLQVLGVRKFPTGDRCRLLVSDGVHKSAFAILASQLNGVTNTENMENAVVKINRYYGNETEANGDKPFKKMMIVLEIAVLNNPGSVIGDPVTFDATTMMGNKPAIGNGRLPSQQSVVRQSAAVPSPNKRPRGAEPEAPQGMPNVRPISSLTPYQNKWTICARITSRGPLRTYSNARGEGKVFSFDLLDESGEIRVTGFNAEADKYYDFVEPNKVIFLSTAQIKTANKQWSKLKNDYEMTLNGQSQIMECKDEGVIPTMQFEFVALSQLSTAVKNQSYDCVGVCHKVSDISSVTKRTTGEELKKREISIIDTSNTSINITLWGETAEKFEGSSNPVIAIKNALVSDFNGVSLSCNSQSTMQINPDISEAHQLKGWWESTGCNQSNITSLSNTGMVGGGGSAPFKTFEDAKREGLGTRKEGNDYFMVTATVVFVRKENILYTACPNKESKCMKKVTDMSNGMYRCEKCNQEFDTFNWRLMASMNLGDFTGESWVSLFQETGEKVLGITAQELGQLKEDDNNRFMTILKEASFKEFNFKLRSKMETYNDETRIKTQVITVEPVNYVEYNKRLIKEIKEMAKLN